MACFYSVLGFLSANELDYSEQGHFDLISSLPLEIASNIFRLLPAKDLLNAVSVCRKWKEIIKSDIRLRRKLRCHLRKMRKARLTNIIRDNSGTRRVRDIPFYRPAMTNINNFFLSSSIQFLCSNVERTDNPLIQIAPSLKRSSAGNTQQIEVRAGERRSKRLRI